MRDVGDMLMQTRRPDHGRLVAVDDAAARLGVSRRMMWQLIAKGAIPVVRLGRRTIRIDESDLELFVQERRERRGLA